MWVQYRMTFDFVLFFIFILRIIVIVVIFCWTVRFTFVWYYSLRMVCRFNGCMCMCVLVNVHCTCLWILVFFIYKPFVWVINFYHLVVLVELSNRATHSEWFWTDACAFYAIIVNHVNMFCTYFQRNWMVSLRMKFDFEHFNWKWWPFC